MVKTGARVNALRSITHSLGWVESAARPPAPRLGALSNTVADSVMALYRELGGVQSVPKLAPGGWDLAFTDGLLLELDEDMHFNRYRKLTLDAPWACDLPWSTAYRGYCMDGESRSGRGGKRWTNPSAEAMFGQADPDGILGEHGAPRWKQRALYDAMKDASATAGQVRLARLSIYDIVGGHLLNDVLYGRVSVDAGVVEELIVQRTART